MESSCWVTEHGHRDRGCEMCAPCPRSSRAGRPGGNMKEKQNLEAGRSTLGSAHRSATLLSSDRGWAVCAPVCTLRKGGKEEFKVEVAHAGSKAALGLLSAVGRWAIYFTLFSLSELNGTGGMLISLCKVDGSIGKQWVESTRYHKHGCHDEEHRMKGSSSFQS